MMMSINDGGPAFPLSPGDVPYYEPGMALRDYIATHADISSSLPLMDRESCEALVGNPMPDDFMGMVGWHFAVVAKLRWMSADAMLAARQEPPHDR
jgi:hypothetical protein